ncbi:DUF6879 family protein [Sphaerisporangium sp. NPDC051011]|uniref:DUF6879 family protein n=1 Tax=Sphaerisporangium sp. NPDC051011 TaxID=3155792 RepID=UPI0033C92ED0
MLDRISDIPGEVLDRAAYHARRLQESEQLTRPIWKLERSQYFQEPDDDPSWQAFLAGEWDRVIAAFESDRAAAQAEAKRYADQGSELRRLRIIERPISPYVRWECHWFKILAEEGTAIRVLDAEKIAQWERERPLPEIVVDEHALYHVTYDNRWKAIGARRINDDHVMREATTEIAGLWSEAEPFLDYFQREIASLSPSIRQR